MKKRITAFLLMLAILVSMFPVINTEPEKANAADTYIDNILGEAEVEYEGDGYRFYLDEYRNLIYRATFNHNSTATLSYHTSDLYFSKEPTKGNPGALLRTGRAEEADAFYHSVNTVGNKSIDTFTVSRSKLEEILINLFGSVEAAKDQPIYVSQGFMLKERESADIPWDNMYFTDVDRSKVYTSCYEIQNAAEWGDETWGNFPQYYDNSFSLDIVQYTITVEAGEGGHIKQSKDVAFKGNNITINAYPDDGYRFLYWSLEEGIIPGFNTTSAESNFVMPPCNLVIKAIFEGQNKPAATKAPVATPDPAKPTPTLAPTPTPVPTPTPPYMPSENSEVIQKSVRYYSTDAGYSIGGVYDKTVTPQDDAFGYVCGGTFDNKTSSFNNNTYTAKGDYSYKVGTDASGNTWYFIPDGSKATFVHPKVYKNHAVDSADVRYITELTFPEKITYGESDYTVTSIGGGADKYCETGSERDGSAWFGEWGPSYNDYDEYINEVYTGEGLRQYTSKGRYGRMLGVIGNGSIWSSYFLHEFYSNSTYEHFEFENSYYVYNTTLRYITIPDTVTRIEDFAFSGCQALEKIMGGNNVTDIGDNAFDAINSQTLQKSYVKYHAEGYIQQFEYYYYNGSFTFDTPTTTMQNWKNSVVLSSYMELPTFGSLKNIGVSAFELRKNLFDVVLPTGLMEIGANAFKDCALDKITVPSISTKIGDVVRPSRTDRANATPEQTLGTKGQGIIYKTLIVTEPYSEAMDYGLLYRDYYDLRSGYTVTYHNNSTPSETYISRSRVELINKALQERVEVYECDTDGISKKAEILLDVDGGLWLDNGKKLPNVCMQELKFHNIYAFEVKENDNSDTVGTEYLKFCLAFAENGTVWGYHPEQEAWISLGVPEGSTNVVMNQSTYGVGGPYGAEVKEMLTLYFLDEKGVLYSKPVYRQETISTYHPEETSYSFGYTLYFETIKNAFAMPTGVTFLSFSIEEHTESSASDFSVPPVITAEDTVGRYWIFSVGMGWRQTEEHKEFSTGAFEEDYSGVDLRPVLLGYEYKEMLYDNMFDAAGREFFGWTTRPDGNGILYQPGEVLRITAPIILYAKWGAAQKKIVYLPNGGIGVMGEDAYDSSVTCVTLKKNNPPHDGYTRKGYEFSGWSYKAEPGLSDVIFSDGATMGIGSGITKLYAQWAPVTYIVRVGFEDMRVVEQSFDEYILGLDEELALGTKGDKKLTVSYDLNDNETQPSMHAKAEFVAELTEQNTKAFLEFYGWRLYEDIDKNGKITADDRYVGYYGSNSVVKNLATEKEAVFYAFPYWGGSASYVQLPEIICDGYMFVGYTPGTAYEPDYFKTPEEYQQAIRENILVPAPIGSGARYQPKADGEVLYAYYESETQAGRVYGFEVYDIFGAPAWEKIRDTEYDYTIGVQDNDSDLWDTLPLRTGVHPIYRNLGGLPMGGGFSFSMESTGHFAEENTILTVIPHLCPVGEDGYYDGNLYFEKKTDRGSFLKKWKPEEQAMVLYADKDSIVTEDGLSRIWTGTFRVPEKLWTAEPSTDVTEYLQKFGLNFEEPFWIKDARLMLRFTLCFTSEDGEHLYYGMLPEDNEENAWVQEAGEPYREDYDKNRYKIYGGEVAIIYPGDSADRWNCIYGIY